MALAFSADDRYLASASGNAAAVSLWRPEDLVALGCGHVSRNLSADEWDEHLGDEPYRKTCQDLRAVRRVEPGPRRSLKRNK